MVDPTADYPYDDEERECCWSCHGEGGYHDCGEDCCPCLYHDGEPDDQDWVTCDECGGSGLC